MNRLPISLAPFPLPSGVLAFTPENILQSCCIQWQMSGPFVQFVGNNHTLQLGGVRLLGMDAAGIGIATGTYESVGYPSIRVEQFSAVLKASQPEPPPPSPTA
jgi:hypothetical protein